MIDVMCLRQAYKQRQVTKVKWIDGDTNPMDAMTKGKPCMALTQLIDTNWIKLWAVGWVERMDSAQVQCHTTRTRGRAIVYYGVGAIAYG